MTAQNLPEATGNCYEQAATFAIDNPDVGAVVVHGVPLLRCEPRVRYGHAWVELPDGTCLGPVPPDKLLQAPLV